MNYRENRSWSDKFIPHIRAIVGPCLLVPSSFEQDTEQAADLVVLKGRNMDIAARVRRPGYLKYRHEFTIRSKPLSGAKTELHKILEGWGDWLFYAHAADDEESLCHWMIVDLHEWRKSLLYAGFSHGWGGVCEKRTNGDGTEFLAFDIRKFQKALVKSSFEHSAVAA